MLKLTNIQVVINKGSPLQRNVLNGLNLHVQSGEFVIIVGSNGCGKSTLFNTISGYIQPDSGQVLIEQQDVTKQTQRQRAAKVALVMQDPVMGTMENMTIEENLSFAYLRGTARKLNFHNTAARRQIFKQKLALLDMNLENRLNDLVVNLSGGQRQALSLIMAILADYQILLLDEITAALDPKSAENVVAIAAKLVKVEKKTAIMITHNMQHALNYGNKTLIMANGNIVHTYNLQDKLALHPVDLARAIECYSNF
jgi:putative ABC transport system ATP-binding protein